jgi:hypothetical protein
VGDIEVTLAEASALSGAVETRDPVTVAATAGEVSAGLVEQLGHEPEGRVTVFPLVVREQVPALLYTWGAVQVSAVELLTQVASAVWGEVSRPAELPLLRIAPAPEPVPEPTAEPASSWESLSAEEQGIHLRAQRFARVNVARLRLTEAEAVQAGRTHRNLYTALQQPIDAARDAFRNSFFTPCTSMVDYYHLELVRTLANDDPELLGDEYPGPMV